MLKQNMSEEDRKSDLRLLLELEGVSTKVFPFDWLCSTDFFRAPASAKYHAAYPGGLYDHSKNVTKQLLDFRNKGVSAIWQRPESPLIVGMLHDVTKIGKYKDMSMGSPRMFYDYVNPLDFGGHGSDSVIKVSLHTQLTEEEAYCIRYHMGAYVKEDWQNIDRAIKRYPNVLWTHVADMVASKLMEETL